MLQMKQFVKQLSKWDMFIKRSPFMLLSENVPNVKEKRKNWTENISNYDAEKMVFVDKSEVNINMTRIYGRSLSATRCVDTPTNITI